MNRLATPAHWLGSRSRPWAAGSLAVGLFLLALVPAAAAGMTLLVRHAWSCAAAGTACSPPLLGAIPQPLLGPVLSLVGTLLAGAGAACLLRRRGRLDAAGQRILDEAKAHFLAGELSTEAFQATRDRLHAKAESREGPQVALALGISAPLLLVMGVLFTLQVAALLIDLRGIHGPAILGTRFAIGVLGAAAVGLVALGLLAARQAVRAARQARADSAHLHAMLRDLEFDILEEVRRSPRLVAAEASSTPKWGTAPPDGSGAEPLAWRPVP